MHYSLPWQELPSQVEMLSRLEREVFKMVISLMWQVVTQALVY